MNENRKPNGRQLNPIDSHVGQRLKALRQKLGVTQEQLGAQLGVTFQQVQKYERGANRVSASRLQMASKHLDVPVSYFFEDAEIFKKKCQAAIVDHEDTFHRQSEELSRVFAMLQNIDVRSHLIRLVKSYVDNERMIVDQDFD